MDLTDGKRGANFLDYCTGLLYTCERHIMNIQQQTLELDETYKLLQPL